MEAMARQVARASRKAVMGPSRGGLGRGEIGLVLPRHTGPKRRWTMRVREKQTDKCPQ